MRQATCAAEPDVQVRLSWVSKTRAEDAAQALPLLGEVRWRADVLPAPVLDLGARLDVLDVSWEVTREQQASGLPPGRRPAPCSPPVARTPLAWQVSAGPHGRQLSWAAPAGGPPGRVVVRYLARADGALAHDRSSGWWATQWSCESWVPCVRSPSLRATWGLTLALPDGMAALQTPGQMPGLAATGGPRASLGVPGYLMGFVAGHARQVVRQTPLGRWTAVGGDALSAEVMEKALARQQQWVTVLADRAGVPWPHQEFLVAYLPMSAAQELNGLILLSAREAEAAADPAQVPWTTVHELAHQWWGNGVTNAGWQDMWLNEGLATYLTQDAIRQLAGDAAADAHLGQALIRWQSLVQRGRDKPLHFPSWDAPTRDDRQVVYDKGAWFFETLRREMGDEAFHAGLKAYTRQHWGRSVTPGDLQAAMQAHTRQALKPLFDAWVWGQGQAPVPPASLEAWRARAG